MDSAPCDQPPKPEDHELDAKRKELLVLEEQLADRERELTALQNSLLAFQRRQQAELEPRYHELSELRIQISELLQRLHPEQPVAKQAVSETSAPRKPHPRRRSHAGARSRPAEPPPPAPGTPPEIAEQLKRLYRDVAKAIHPDLATDDAERQRRHQLMVRANEAYDLGEPAKLQEILHEWDTSPEAIRGQGTIPELIRAIRRIHRARKRLVTIGEEIARLSASSIFGLKAMSDAADQYERDLLKEMTDRLDRDLDDARAQLARLQAQAPDEQRTTSN